MQVLEELVREYEEHRDKKNDNDLKLQRLYDILPKPIEQQLVLEDRDGSATYESVKRRANTWIMMNSTGRADMELGTMGCQWRTRKGLVRRLDGTKGVKGKQGTGQYNGYCFQCGQWGHGKEQRVDSNSVLHLWALGTCGKIVL